MNILAVGDVVGKSGCEFLRKKLPELKRRYSVDVTIVNGENSAEGNGITPFSADSIFASGADGKFTTFSSKIPFCSARRIFRPPPRGAGCAWLTREPISLPS